MPFDDLMRAFGAFNEGVTHLATARALDTATQQVQEINNSQQDEMAKRQQLSQMGNSLALQLAKFNTPVSQIQSAVGAIKPKEFTEGKDMFLAGLQSGDQKTQELGQRAIDVENQPKLDVANIAANADISKARIAADATMNKLSAKEQKALDDSVLKLHNDVDATRGRAGAFGVQQAKAFQVRHLLKATDGMKNLDDASETIIQELAAGTASLFANGSVPTVSGIQGLLPKNKNMTEAEIKSWILSEPKGAKQKKFMELMLDQIKRQGDVSEDIVAETVLKRAASHAGKLRKTRPDDWELALQKSGLNSAVYDAFIQNGATLPPNWRELTSKGKQQGQAAGQAPGQQQTQQGALPPGTHIETRRSNKTGIAQRMLIDSKTGKAIVPYTGP
jgi:hypothetical protein